MTAEELLDIAGKATPGEWVAYSRYTTYWRLRRYNVGQLAEGLKPFRRHE
jgi:hypothetical protein